MQERQLDINGRLVNYYCYAAPERIPASTVIFLHGWRSDGAVWLPIMERLAGLGIASYGIDLPGFGKSPAPKSAWRVSDYADTAASFIEKLGLKSAILAGHSFGGRVAIKFAATNPDLLEKLVLIDSAGIKDDPAMKTFKFVAAKIFKPFFAPIFMQPFRRKLYSLIGAEDYIATPKLRQTFLNITDEDLMPLLPRINADTLIVWGERDRVTPLDFARQIARTIPKSRLAIIPNAGHFSFLDQPEKFFEIVKNFIGPISAKK